MIVNYKYDKIHVETQYFASHEEDILSLHKLNFQ